MYSAKPPTPELPAKEVAFRNLINVMIIITILAATTSIKYPSRTHTTEPKWPGSSLALYYYYRPSLYSTNEPTTRKQLMEEASSSRSLKGVGRGEN